MSVLKASSALALCCNVFGHVPLWECLFSAFKVSSNCSIIFFFWKCFSVAAFSVLVSFVILWFVFVVKGGQVVPCSVFLLFFLLLQSVSWRSLTWFWVRFRKLVFLSSLLQHWPAFRQCLNRPLRTVWDQSSSDSRRTSEATIPLCFGFFRCRVDVLQS